jgi:hypothetical protein
LNPLKGEQNRLTEEELRKLCETKDVSFCDYNPPHPYMYARPQKNDRPIIKDRKHQPLGGAASQYLVPIDPKNPQWPDCAGEIAQDKEFEQDLLKEIQKELHKEY